MALSIRTLKIDVSQEMSFVSLKCKQYDNLSRKYRVIFCNKGMPLTMTGKEAVSIRMWREGDDKPYINKFLDWEDGYPVVVFTSGMLSFEGKISVDYQIYDPMDLSSISTRTSYIKVQKSLIDYEGLIAEEDFNILDQLIQDALKVPDLIATFNVSQEEINSLIEKINADITAYQNSYNNLNTDATELIAALRAFLVECQDAEAIRISNENTRIENETLRQSNTATAIANANAATAATIKAIEDAEQATADTTAAIDEAYEQASYAYTQAEACKAAIEALHYEMVDMDGGDAYTNESAYENDFNGGGA